MATPPIFFPSAPGPDPSIPGRRTSTSRCRSRERVPGRWTGQAEVAPRLDQTGTTAPRSESLGGGENHASAVRGWLTGPAVQFVGTVHRRCGGPRLYPADGLFD